MKPIVLKLGYGSSLPVLEPDKAEIIDLNHLQPLGNGIKDKLDPILRQLDREVVGQRVPVSKRSPQPDDEIQFILQIYQEYIPSNLLGIYSPNLPGIYSSKMPGIYSSLPGIYFSDYVPLTFCLLV